MNQETIARASEPQKPDESDNRIAIYYRQSGGCFEAGGEVYNSVKDLKKRFPESSYKLFVDRRRKPKPARPVGPIDPAKVKSAT